MVMLYMVGLGLDGGEITVKGLEALEEVEVAFAEFYTNTENIDLEELERRTGTGVRQLSREDVEQKDLIIEAAEERDTAFLVSGDPLTATTHYDIKKRAETRGIEVEVVHAPSIFTAVAETGLSLYRFGRTVTLPEDSSPGSVAGFIEKNDSVDLHTLVLLDIDYAASDAAEKLVSMKPGLEKREAVFLSRANTPSQQVEIREIGDAVGGDFGEPPHSIIIIGNLSHTEEEFLEEHR